MKDWSILSVKPIPTASSSLLPNATAQQPDYNAAGQGRRLRSWRAPVSGPNTTIVRDLPIIRARARAAARNDPWAGAAIEKGDANGIGTGIQAKMIFGSEELQAAIKKLWVKWMKVSDADGVLSFYGQQYLAWHEWSEAGEVFVRKRARRPSDGLPVPFQVQIIEAEQCPADLNTIASNGNKVRAGIEFNAIGQRVAYWMYTEHPGDASFFSFGGFNGLSRIPAKEILHLFRPMRAGQIRGIPDSVSVLVKMFNIENLDDAVLERQKIANLFAGFYKAEVDPENPDSMIDEMTDDEAETDDDDIPLAGLEPGTMQELPPGYSTDFSNPPSPGAEYGEFLRGHLLAVAARNGVPYEVLTGDLRDVSDRALKLILNEFRRGLEMKQWLFFIPQFCQPIREAWFDSADVAGLLNIDDYQAQRDEIVETLWVPQGWPYSHPVQDVTADLKAIRGGLDSRDDAILRRGADPEQIDKNIDTGNTRADGYGLVLDSDPRKTSSAGPTQARAPGTELPSTDSDDDPENKED